VAAVIMRYSTKSRAARSHSSRALSLAIALPANDLVPWPSFSASFAATARSHDLQKFLRKKREEKLNLYFLFPLQAGFKKITPDDQHDFPHTS
jgi:hypothetical protein